MKSEIIHETADIIYHKKHTKEVVPSKEVQLWRGLDKKTYSYILNNCYYPTETLIRNRLDFMIELKERRGTLERPTNTKRYKNYKRFVENNKLV